MSRWFVHPRRAVVLGAVLVYFILIGGTELGGLVPIRVLNGVVAAWFVVAWIRSLGSHADLTDRLALGALICFLLACVLSAFPRSALDAAVEGVAYASVFSVTRWELRRNEHTGALLMALGIAGVLFVSIVFSAWSSWWQDWLAGAGMLPPLDARLAAGPYRHPHVAAMMVALLAPAFIALLGGRRAGWVIWGSALVLGAAVIYMAGGRAVWAAVAVVGLGSLFVVRLPAPRMLALLGGVAVLTVAVGVVSGLADLVVDRLGVVSTISLRGDYWGETIQQWGEKPVQGWGPGSFSTLVTLGDYFDTQAFVPRHADNAVIQVLGEAGILGIASLGLIALAVVVGFRASPTARLALAALVLFVLLSMTDNPSDTPNLAIVGVMWAAIATAPHNSLVAIEARRPSVPRFFTWAAAAVAAAAMCSTMAAAALYEQARDVVATHRASATSLLAGSVALDPGMGLYRRSLALQRWWAGDASLAERELAAAAAMSPADAATLRALALVRADLGDDGGALTAAQSAVDRRSSDTANQIVMAMLAHSSGDNETARDAVVKAIAFQPWLAGSHAWGEIGLLPLVAPALEPAYSTARDLATQAATWRVSEAWLAALTDQPLLLEGAALAALHDTLSCMPDRARAWLSEDFTVVAESDVGLMAALLLARLESDSSLFDRAATIARLRSAPVSRALNGAEPDSPLEAPGEDRRLYGVAGIDSPDLVPHVPAADEALGVWVSDPRGTAATAAPRSRLAGGC